MKMDENRVVVPGHLPDNGSGHIRHLSWRKKTVRHFEVTKNDDFQVISDM
jgi:hypothetical protein